MILNGNQENITERVKRIIDIVRDRATNIQAIDENGKSLSFDRENLITRKVKIESNNNFPTASGLASSSSGLSCLAYLLA